MKSTVKIAFQSNMSPELPVIKIVQPIDYNNGIFPPHEDHDPKDEMLNSFLNKPASNQHHPFFRVSTSFPHPIENPTHWITTLTPVEEHNVLYNMRHMILNRFVPNDTIVALNRMSEKQLDDYYQNDQNKVSSNIEKSILYQKIHSFFNELEAIYDGK